MTVSDLVFKAKEGTKIRIMAKNRLEEIGQSKWFNELLPLCFADIPYDILALEVESYEVIYGDTILIR